MKNFNALLTITIAALSFTCSCKHIFPPKEGSGSLNDTIVSAEFSGVKRYVSNGKLIKELTFKKGMKDGLNTNYYDDGRVKSTIWYTNGLRSDTAKWYYPEGNVYRATPYTNDTINGVQVKYYKSGGLMAEIPYIMGLRSPGLKEYYEDGRLVKGMPSIESEINQSFYKSDGKIRILIKLSNGSTNAEYYKGSLLNGAFDPSSCTKITISSGMGFIELETDKVKGRDYVDVIAVYTTRFRNREIISSRIKLPYSDLY